MSTTIGKLPRAIAATALVAAIAGAVGAREGDASTSGTSDRELATALVVARGDALPRNWTIHEFNNDARGKCLMRSRGTVKARARDGFGSPNDGMWSVATVLKTRREARADYNMLRDAVPACLRRAVRHNPVDADAVGFARSLSFRRYGDRSAAWRLGVTYSGNAYRYDWVLVQTGRAVLVELFVLGRDRPGAVAMEQEIVRRALRRAATTT